MANISVILNVYRRPHTLEKQIESVLNQSVEIKPENIHVWYNESGVEQALPNDKSIKTYKCNWNTKFHGRFTIPLLLNTEFVAMFDDDVLPNKDWFKNCLDSMNRQEGIYGASGIHLHQDNYTPHTKVGYNGIKSNGITPVDLVGHAWFFKREWAKYLWYEEPIRRDNGEDIMFSYLCQKYGNINTFVPPHPENNKEVWGSDYEYGFRVGCDENASWKIGSHYNVRNMIVKECINRGWKTVRSDG